MRVLDLFCGRWGWSRAFAARGWECWGVDILPRELGIQCMPRNSYYMPSDVLHFSGYEGRRFDFIVASPPCEEFSVWGMRHFNPNPKYPEMGIRLFNHTRQLCEDSGVPYVIENVRAAQQFVGPAAYHCGPFYLWGNAVPPLMPQGIRKGMDTGGTIYKSVLREQVREYLKVHRLSGAYNSKSKERKEIAAQAATIPPELANCVADYAERILEKVCK